jgi:hypothetical protein
LNPQDQATAWSIAGVLFSSLCALSVFAYRKLYADLEKEVADHAAEIKLLQQRLTEVIVAQAKAESVAHAVNELRQVVEKIRWDVYQVVRHMPSYRPPTRSNSNE